MTIAFRPCRFRQFRSLPAFSLTIGALGTAAFAAAAPPAKPADLFQSTKVWTVHLQLTAAQYQAMEPKGGGPGGPGGMGAGRGGFGPGRPGGPGRGGFGPSMMALPGFMQADKDKDGKVSDTEFRALGEEWFANWDKAKLGTLNSEQLQAGINTTFPMPGLPGGGGPGRGVPGGPGRPGGMPGMQTDFPYAHADLEFEGATFKDVAIRYKGNSTYMQSRDSLKRSMKIDLNKYVKGQKLAGVTRLNLHSDVMDPGFMNESISYRLFREAKVPASRTAYARVYLSVTGKYDKQYVGLFAVVEEVGKEFMQERLPEGGALWKPEGTSAFAFLGDDWTAYDKIYDPKTALSPAQKQRVIDFAKFVKNATDAQFAAGVASYLDLDQFARFLAVNVWLVNGDSILSMGHNFYIYLHPKTDQFLFFPWDLDLAFGHFPLSQGGTALSILHPWTGQNRLIERVFEVDAFKKIYLAHMAEFNKTLFVPQQISRQVDELAVAIRPAVKEESEAKLVNFDKAVAGENVPPNTGGNGRGAGGMGRMIGGGAPIKAFLEPRSKSVADQLSGKSAGQSSGGGGFMGMGMGGIAGMMLAPAFLAAMDTDKDGSVSHQEFTAGFAKWFESWGGRAGGGLTEEQIRAGLDRDLPMRGMPGFGPPPVPPAPAPVIKPIP